MPLAIPPELKKISAYIRRAEELDRDKAPESRLLAFYCRQYAVHVGIPLSKSQPAKVCLGHILENLEAEKPAMDNFTREEAAFLCRQFANKVFDKANAEDRMGLANQGTAKTFYAASTFLQILEQFYDDSDESEDRAEDRKRIVFAKWKSTDILKAIKEGRTPKPGGFGEGLEEDDEEGEEVSEKKEDAPSTQVETVDSDDDEVEAASNSHVPVAPPLPVEDEDEEEVDVDQGLEVELGPPPAYPGDFLSNQATTKAADRPKLNFDLAPPVQPTPLPVAPVSPPKSKVGGLFGFGSNRKKGEKATKAQLADATELARFALAALEDKDADLAAERLQGALQALGR